MPLFAEVRRILKPGGTFVFDIRNAFNPLIRLQYAFVKLYDPYIKVPVHAVSPRTAEQFLNDAGFTVLRQEYIGFPGNIFAPAILFITTAGSEAGTS